MAEADMAAAEKYTGAYYSITDPGDPGPWALIRAEGGLYEQWVAGTGWVDMPYFSSYFGGGEPGADEITEAEAETLKGLVKAPPPAAIALLGGSVEGNPNADPTRPPDPAADPPTDPAPPSADPATPPTAEADAAAATQE